MRHDLVSSWFFRQQGYLLLPGIIPTGEIDHIRHIVMDIANAGRDAVGQGMTSGVTRIDRIAALGEPFATLVRSPKLLEAIQPLIGPNVEFIENRHNHISLCSRSRRSRAHRDILQWSRSMVTVLIYLSDCSSPQSATQMVPGSRLWPCLGEPNNGGTWLDEVTALGSLERQALPVPAAPGDALCLDGLLYHSAGGSCGAGANPRIVLSLAFRSVDELAVPDDPHRHLRLVSGTRIYGGNRALDCCPFCARGDVMTFSPESNASRETTGPSA